MNVIMDEKQIGLPLYMLIRCSYSRLIVNQRFMEIKLWVNCGDFHLNLQEYLGLGTLGRLAV